MACQYCGSENIIRSIVGSSGVDVGNIALEHKKGIFVAYATVYFDLCKNCGSITRMYIKESTDKKWNIK